MFTLALLAAADASARGCPLRDLALAKAKCFGAMESRALATRVRGGPLVLGGSVGGASQGADLWFCLVDAGPQKRMARLGRAKLAAGAKWCDAAGMVQQLRTGGLAAVDGFRSVGCTLGFFLGPNPATPRPRPRPGGTRAACPRYGASDVVIAAKHGAWLPLSQNLVVLAARSFQLVRFVG